MFVLTGIPGQITNGEAVTWVGLLSGGLPVAAVLIVIVWYVVRRQEKSEARIVELLARIDQLQEDRLKERDALLRETLPVVKATGDALMRATVLWDRQVNQTGGGR